MDRVREELHSVRRSVMLGRSLGLTKLYNLVHDPAVIDERIRRLREIHTEIDYATAQAYGWDDLDLGHGFHETRQGLHAKKKVQTRRKTQPKRTKSTVERPVPDGRAEPEDILF